MSDIVPLSPQPENLPEIVKPAGPRGIEGLHGDFGSLRGRLPQFKLIQNVGALSAKWPDKKGEYLFGENVFLPKPVKFTIYGADILFQANTLFDEGVFPMVYSSEQEVLDAGGNLRAFVKAGTDPNNFVPIIMATMVAELPKPAKKDVPVDGAFTFNGSSYVAGVWVARGNAQRALAGKLATVQTTMRAEDKKISHFKWLFESRYSKSGSFFVYLPIINREPSFNSDEFVGYLREEVFAE